MCLGDEPIIDWIRAMWKCVYSDNLNSELFDDEYGEEELNLDPKRCYN